MEKKILKSLTSLRGVMIMCIVIYHTHDLLGDDILLFEPLYKYGGYLGNYFFFLLSGFLSCMSYRDKISKGLVGIERFILKKILKWYPLYLITNVIQLIRIVRVSGIRGALPLRKLIPIFTMTATGWMDDYYPYNFPCWFICTLLLMQFVFYMIMRIYSYRNLYRISVLIMIVWGYILMTYNFNFPFMYNHDGEGLFNFFMGVILYDIFELLCNFEKNGLTHYTINSKLYTSVFSLVCFAILILMALLCISYGVKDVCGDVRFVFTIVIIPSLIFVILKTSVLDRLFSLKILYGLGLISVHIYFWHIPLKDFFMDINFFEMMSMVICRVLYFATLIVISGISYCLTARLSKR